MRYSKELLKGSTPLLVLSVLQRGDQYGYRIIRELEEASEKAFQMTEGTLYPILHALEEEGLLESYWRVFDGRNRKYYHITEKGKGYLGSLKADWDDFSKMVNDILRGEEIE